MPETAQSALANHAPAREKVVMSDPHFFGYGSLVNRATHTYSGCHTARLTGWKRMWRHTNLRPVAYLTAIPAPGYEIDGLVASVPQADWGALDSREHGYDRVAVTDHVAHPLEYAPDIQVYAVNPKKHGQPAQDHPIWLSYLDVVVQGYLREFGPAGLTDFFETTDGWDTLLINDRNAPRYPRHQVLTTGERDLCDHWLARLPAVVQQL
jgi:hypothetical protein